MLHNDAFLKWKSAREKLTHRAVDARSAPAVGTSAGGYGHSNRESSNSGTGDGGGGKNDRMPKQRTKNESAEWYVARFMDGTVTVANVASLAVCLRTYELSFAFPFYPALSQHY